MGGVKYIVKKELNRVFSDKKLIMSLFILPAIMVIGMLYLIGQMASNVEKDKDENIPVVYIQNAPEEVKTLIDQSELNAEITYLLATEATEGIKTDIMNGEAELLYVFEEQFSQKLEAYQEAGDEIASVDTYYNSSEDYSSVAKSMFDPLLINYQQNILAKRFGSLELLTAFHMNENELVDEERATGQALGLMLPYFLTMMLFSSAMGLGIDAIAGEKERGTLASMLLTPLKRQELVMGKLISLAILSSLSAAVYCGSMSVAIPLMINSMSDGESMNIAVRFQPEQVIELLLLMIAMVFLYVAIISLVAVLAKNTKEAGTYVSPVYIIVIVAGLITMYTGNKEPALFEYAIPLYGNAIAMQKILEGGIPLVNFLASIGGTIILALVLVAGITKAFNSEKVMFNA